MINVSLSLVWRRQCDITPLTYDWHKRTIERINEGWAPGKNLDRRNAACADDRKSREDSLRTAEMNRIYSCSPTDHLPLMGDGGERAGLTPLTNTRYHNAFVLDTAR